MDTSIIKGNQVKPQHGIHVGKEDAPVKVMDFINLSCPYCKKWFEESLETLQKFIDEGKVERIIKHFDKEKPGLRKGNVLHHYLDYSTPEKAVKDIAFFYEHQEDWGNLEEEQVAKYAEEERNLTPQDNQEEAKAIVEEAERANVTLVPSVFIGEHIFDESVTQEELVQYIEEELEKKDK